MTTPNNLEALVRTRNYKTIRIESDAADRAYWLYMHADVAPGVRPCFRRELMEDMHAFLDSITLPAHQRSLRQLRHVVLASEASAFNLGGDLELFAELIRNGSRESLLTYARDCIDGVHAFNSGLGGDVRTIALVQGDALGGGLEMALSCQTIVAEEGVGMGLPEVLFGLFPGMGAYSFLCKRVSAQLAEKIILEGRIYSSEEMKDMGIVDVLTPKGEGAATVRAIIRQQQRTPQAYLALNAVRQIGQPVGYDELMRIAEVWVDSALALDIRSLKTMDRIVNAQHRRTRVKAAAA
ncbi:enoyl-CoA hydratase [Lysobacter pythonis]|uniref:Enoyl-CoA hydratase n=1 Tax=Solilutibacter pythonis TaxID=2483112 RepID=A0A3M2HP63_9GAMM|nr:crotonase/enoyl-CoA hydratase family protein [Lysobacter pythonis]RMH90818.1 enoyl-CoA hydratase [Lysobacter pythonis]